MRAGIPSHPRVALNTCAGVEDPPSVVNPSRSALRWWPIISGFVTLFRRCLFLRLLSSLISSTQKRVCVFGRRRDLGTSADPDLNMQMRVSVSDSISLRGCVCSFVRRNRPFVCRDYSALRLAMDRGGRYQPIQRRESIARLRFTKGHVTRGVALASMARSVHCAPSLREPKCSGLEDFFFFSFDLRVRLLVSRMVGVCVFVPKEYFSRSCRFLCPSLYFLCFIFRLWVAC